MKKKRNIAIVLILTIALITIGGFTVYKLWIDGDLFTVDEKKYLIDNKSKLISINIVNDVNIFGKDGEGVFYDYIHNLEKENDISFDIVTTTIGGDAGGLVLKKGTVLPVNTKLFYTDHYVIVGKTQIDMANPSDIKDTIGYLTKDQELITSGLKNYTLTLKNYEDKTSMLEGLEKDEVSYIIVPLVEYLDVILDKLYIIEYHLSDIKDYYYLQGTDDATLMSIMSKYHNQWNTQTQKESINKAKYKLFIDKLKITEKELDVINNKKYRYGFVNYAPYDVKYSGVYGGTVAQYIKSFSDFSEIDFEYDEYSNLEKFKTALQKNQIDLFMNYYDIETSLVPVESLYRLDISFIMSNTDNRVINNLNAINNETVYVKENTFVYTYLASKGLNLTTYKSDKDLKKILSKNNIVAMTRSNYLAIERDNVDINERFRIDSNRALKFQSNNDTMFNRLFYYYISTIDKNEIIYTGLDDYIKTLKSGSLIYKIAKYAILLILIISFIVYIIYKIGKKAFKRKKIKRNDKMKYIDILTSMKNRNYLNENIPIWNQNTIYPQAIIVVDLNCIQELNETLGYTEGDKQIQGAANILIRTQLDNSEIMRTDGNEFTVYLVGYNEKQIISYIKKLNKAFKDLPHDKGAAVGFSMIEDDLKLVNDAVNEASEKMRENKSLFMGDNDEQKS